MTIVELHPEVRAASENDFGGGDLPGPVRFDWRRDIMDPSITPDQQASVTPESVSIEEGHSAGEIALDTAAAVVVGVNLPIAFETVWGGMTAAAAQTHNPYVAAGLVTLGVAALEVGSAFGASRLLAKESTGWAMRQVYKGLGKVGLRFTAETTLPTDVAVDFVAGAPVMLATKQALDPTRTEEQNRSRGIKTAIIATALGAPVNLAVAEGVQHITPENVGLAALAVAGLFAARSQVKKVIQRRAEARTQAAESRDYESTPARYNLSAEELTVLESNIVERARATNGKNITAVWIKGDMPEANFVRTHEHQALPEADVPSLFGQYEDRSIFMVFVDTRKGPGRVIRGTRITGRSFDEQKIEGDGQSHNGMAMAMLRDMVIDKEVSSTELQDYYNDPAHALDLDKCISVETNFRIGERAQRRLHIPMIYKGIPMADLSYLSMYRFVCRNNTEDPDVAIFAHINSASLDSLERSGVDISPIAGRVDLKTPAGPNAPSRYDDKFSPVVMANTSRTQRTMRRLQRFAPKQLVL